MPGCRIVSPMSIYETYDWYMTKPALSDEFVAACEAEIMETGEVPAGNVYFCIAVNEHGEDWSVVKGEYICDSCGVEVEGLADARMAEAIDERESYLYDLEHGYLPSW